MTPEEAAIAAREL